MSLPVRKPIDQLNKHTIVNCLDRARAAPFVKWAGVGSKGEFRRSAYRQTEWFARRR